MKKIFISIFFIVGFINNAWCDNFQISFQEGAVTYYISYASVKLFDSNGKEVFAGSTDKYGRVIIPNLPNGTNYRVEVYYRNHICGVAVSIDNANSDFKQIYLSSRNCS